MKTISMAKGFFVCTLSLICACVFYACSSSSTTGSGTSGDGAVAATVNGVEIYENAITQLIENLRVNNDVVDDDSWAEWLNGYGYTPESIREEVIDEYIDQEILRQYASDLGVSVESSEIDTYVDAMREYYDNDEATWQAALSTAGMTEDEYRENLELSLLYQGVVDDLVGDDLSEETLSTYGTMYASIYDGAKRSSQILFKSDDEKTAENVLDKLRAGTLDFADAVKEYSQDETSAEDGGDVGWDVLADLADEYEDALDELELDQISDLVTSEYGIHIIKCTEIYTAPEEITSLDDFPDEIADKVKEYLISIDQETAYNDWIDECREKADIVINDMPEDASYIVDMSAYEEEEEEEEADSDADMAEADDKDDDTDDKADADNEADDKTDAADATEASGEAETSDKTEASGETEDDDDLNAAGLEPEKD